MTVNGQWVPCVRNSSYSFIPILLKLYRCLHLALKICMWFGYDAQINFYYFCSQFELCFSVILTMKVYGQGYLLLFTMKVNGHGYIVSHDVT